MINQLYYSLLVCILTLCSRGSLVRPLFFDEHEGNPHTLFLTSKIITVDRGQAQSTTTAGERQTAVNTFDRYYHEATTARGNYYCG
jgi:hypothetical protein